MAAGAGTVVLDQEGQLRLTLAGHQERGCGSLMTVEPHSHPLAFL